MKNKGCYYCIPNENCSVYPFKAFDPVPSCGTGLQDIQWRTCKLSLKTILITVGTLGGILLVALLCCCCYCCCCRGGSDGGQGKEWLKFEKMRSSRKAATEEKRKERQERMNDIRQKYGLTDSMTAQDARYTKRK